MTPDVLRRLSAQRAILGRASFVGEPKSVHGGIVEITLRMSRTDFTDLAWSLSSSPDERPGAWTMPQLEKRE